VSDRDNKVFSMPAGEESEVNRLKGRSKKLKEKKRE
jgi:hypothetical protein